MLDYLTEEQKALIEAIRKEDFVLVKKMVEGGVSPNFCLEEGGDVDFNPICVCSMRGYFDLAVWLINEGGAIVNDNIKRFVNNVIGDFSLSLFFEQNPSIIK